MEDEAGFGFVNSACDGIHIKDTLQACHGIQGLRLPRGGDFDHFGVEGTEHGDEIRFKLRLGFVLSALPGEDDAERETTVVEYRVTNGIDDRILVFARFPVIAFFEEKVLVTDDLYDVRAAWVVLEIVVHGLMHEGANESCE